MSAAKSTDDDVRALKVVLPAELKTQLKVEAVELDIMLRDYVRQILEDRLPWGIREKLAERAKSEGLTYREFLLRVFRNAGLIE